uniref:Secreted protein n=1 Tax=Anguilla anguilla TaxID=7936 RepID=A0A0E9R7K8_ANGAN
MWWRTFYILTGLYDGVLALHWLVAGHSQVCGLKPENTFLGTPKWFIKRFINPCKVGRVSSSEVHSKRMKKLYLLHRETWCWVARNKHVSLI